MTFTPGNVCRGLLQHRLHASGNLVRRVRRIVRADHEHGDLRPERGDVHVLEPPERMLGRVRPDAEIERATRSVVLGPNVLAALQPALGDRVADEDQVAGVPFHRRHLRLAGMIVRGVTSRVVGIARHRRGFRTAGGGGSRRSRRCRFSSERQRGGSETEDGGQTED